MIGQQLMAATESGPTTNDATCSSSSPSLPACPPFSLTPANSSFEHVLTQVYDYSLGGNAPMVRRNKFDLKTYLRSWGKRSVRSKFNLKTWDKKSNGGLMDEDRLAVAKYYSSSNSVFEWGLGESTYIASHVGVPRYAGIDSDAVWVSMARSKSLDHFRFYYGDIGDTAAWGQPANPSLVKIILDYQLAPLIVEPHPFDVYTVDGRYRVACMMLAFLHASARGAQKDATIVLLHDCYDKERSGSNYNHNARRSIYDKASHLLELVDHSGYRLCVYKRKSDTTDEQLLEIWKSIFRKSRL
jgi:hypothetical protein